MKRIGLLSCVVLQCLLDARRSHRPWRRTSEEPKWQGVDKTVVEKYAKESAASRASRSSTPTRGTCSFSSSPWPAGAGGFVMGYYWHKLFVAGRKDEDKKE